MKAERTSGYPSIAADLVLPFERPYFEGRCRFPVLVFARRGALVLFAAENKRQFGIGYLDATGTVGRPNHFPSLDMAARVFLSLGSCAA